MSTVWSSRRLRGQAWRVLCVVAVGCLLAVTPTPASANALVPIGTGGGSGVFSGLEGSARAVPAGAGGGGPASAGVLAAMGAGRGGLGVPGLAGLVVVQRADVVAKVPGSVVTYKVTVANRGAVPLQGVRLRDDLRNLLDDAVYQGDVSATQGQVAYADPAISWTGDLSPGASATISYSVVINDPDMGDHVLESKVVSDAGVLAEAKDQVQLPLDYGDAPDRYLTTARVNGPTEVVSRKLRIGAVESSESDAHPGNGAKGDDGDDGVASFPPLKARARSYSLNVAVTNTTGRPAALAGWIDFDGNGVFDHSERAVVEVPSGATSVKLVWRGLHGIKGKKTYLRLRLDQASISGIRLGRSAASAAWRGRAYDRDIEPFGPGGIGEVEDFRVPVDSVEVSSESERVSKGRDDSSEGSRCWAHSCHRGLFSSEHFGCGSGHLSCAPFHPFRRRLPFTGAPVDQTVRLALLLLLGGYAAVALTRRRSGRASSGGFGRK